MKCDVCRREIRDRETGLIIVDGNWEIGQEGGNHDMTGQEFDTCAKCGKMIKAMIGAMLIWMRKVN